MTAAADRHLLFGLLALQNGLIDQVQLVAAFQAWTRDKSIALADHLVARGDLDPGARAGLDAIVASHVMKHGDVEQSLAAVPATRGTRASLAALGEPEIEATLARVALGENGQATQADYDPDRTGGFTVGESPESGQRFRLLRPHARGGLGEVFVALDAELHREVALKQILDKHADDPVSRRRFVAEAEITGGLEHPGVVPVYGLGAHSGGRPYYAMRFVRGESLKEAIEHFHGDKSLKETPGRRSLELRKLLRRFTDVCNAVDYAHSRGVIHRDLKPANIVLGKHGETLVVDWGLAKAVGRADPSAGEHTIAPSSSRSSDTLPGSALGTPAYMSPEQAAGDLDRLSPRSDVYSLGATLYCLLCGKPPYEGDDLGEILRKVLIGDFALPRAVSPSLDRALEAVCLKAMATKPEDRHPSCRALADDVDRWMADEPVSAWAEPWTRKLLRWLTRHRTGVTGAAAAVLAGVLGLSGVLAVQTQANSQLSDSLNREKSARTALSAANNKLVDEQAKVQARFELAQKAIATFHTGVAEDMLLKNDQFKSLRTELLKGAAGFYGDLENLLIGQTDARSRTALATGFFQLAELTRKIGSAQEALAVHRKALAIRRELATESGANLETRLNLARSLRLMGVTLYRTGDSAGALSSCEEALDLAQTLEVDHPTNEVRSVLADIRSYTGTLLSVIGKPVEALAVHQKSLAIREKLAATEPADTGYQLELSWTYNDIGHALRASGKPAEALEAHRKALAIAHKLADDKPAVARIQMNLAGTYNNIGLILSRLGQPSEALEAQSKALPIRQRLVDANPAVSDFQGDLGWCHDQIAGLLLRTGQPADALAEYRKAVAAFEKTADADLDTPWLSNLAYSHIGIGQAHARERRFAEALAAMDAGLAILERLAQRDQKSADVAGELGYGYALRGLARFRAGSSASAAADLRRAVELRDNFSHLDDPRFSPPDVRFTLAQTLALLAGLQKDPRAQVTAAEAATFAEQSVAALRDAISAGWADRDQLKQPDFDSVRNRANFQKLVSELEAKIARGASQKDGS
jgi:serine/threonine-protein kinase